MRNRRRERRIESSWVVRRSGFGRWLSQLCPDVSHELDIVDARFKQIFQYAEVTTETYSNKRVNVQIVLERMADVNGTDRRIVECSNDNWETGEAASVGQSSAGRQSPDPGLTD